MKRSFSIAVCVLSLSLLPALARGDEPAARGDDAVARGDELPTDDAAAAAEAAAETVLDPVRPWAYKRLERAFAALADQRYDEVLEALDEMKPNTKLNPHELALMWQTYGYAYTNQEKYGEAADAFAHCLAQDSLPASATLHTRYNLAQLLVMLERPEEAIAEFDKWFAAARNPSPTAYYMAAMAHMQKGDNQAALRYARRALEATNQPKESWLQLVVALHFKEDDYKGAEPTLLELIEHFPKKSYWMQLAAVYSETGRQGRALTVLELAHTQGMLDQGSEYMALAQMYLYNQIPYEAAKVLEEGLEKKLLPRDAKTLQLLADSWLHSREPDKALAPMREAAALTEDGNGYFRVAQILVDREAWGEAREALTEALEKGDLNHPGHVNLLLGIANVNEKRWDDAQAAFAAAAQDERTASAASYWLQQVETHLARKDESGDAGDAVAAPIAPANAPRRG